MGGDIPRKKGPALAKSDMLVVNKVELAPHVGVDLETMAADTATARNGRPFIFGSMQMNDGVAELGNFILYEANLES